MNIKQKLSQNNWKGQIDFTIETRDPDLVVAKMPVSEEAKNPFGTMHAGALIWFADIAATLCAVGDLESIDENGIAIETYQDQIAQSEDLSLEEKQRAHSALSDVFEEIANGELHDFRMIIRGQHRITHSDSETISHRAKRLREAGFYFLRYNPLGSKPSDVWGITSESTRNREGHYAAYPERLCRLPLLTTCPADGVALDPFCGTGTTMKVATDLGVKSVGIDLSQAYISMAKMRSGKS